MSNKRLSEPSILPDEIIVSILNKLDVRDVARCRCVCRRWKDLTSDEYFVDSLGSHSAPMIFVDYQGSESRKLLLDNWWEGAPRRINYNFPVYTYHKNGVVSQLFPRQSQNGFFFFESGNVFSIINPINREHVRIILPKLPDKSNTKIIGIFLHPVSREYCTLWHVLYNLGIQPCWRAIKHPFSQEKVLAREAVSVGDFFYWMVTPYGLYVDHSNKSIMAFDIKTEEVSSMPFPHDFNTDYYDPTIYNADGFLSIVKTKIMVKISTLIRTIMIQLSIMLTDRMKIMVKISTLKDRERTLWTTSHCVFNCVNHLKHRFSGLIIHIIDEEVLFRVHGTGREFLLGNLKHGTLRKLVCYDQKRDNGWLHTVLFHKPSLASLRKCKRVIRFDLEDKEDIEDLVEYKSSSSIDLNILVEGNMNLGQSRHPTDI